MAYKFLEECCMGSAHFLGQSHPRYKKTLAALQGCWNLQGQTREGWLDHINDLDHHIGLTDGSDVTTTSRAYDHMELKTAIHLLAGFGNDELRQVLYIFNSLLSRKVELGKDTTPEQVSTLHLRMYRTLAWCMFESGYMVTTYHQAGCRPDRRPRSCKFSSKRHCHNGKCP